MPDFCPISHLQTQFLYLSTTSNLPENYPLFLSDTQLNFYYSLNIIGVSCSAITSWRDNISPLYRGVIRVVHPLSHKWTEWNRSSLISLILPLLLIHFSLSLHKVVSLSLYLLRQVS